MKTPVYILKKGKFIYYLQASLTGTTIEQSTSGSKNNTQLLKEAEEQEYEEENSDADVTIDASKINEDDYNMVISME